MGAVPLLVAVRRTDNLLLKSVFLAGSGLAGFSRLNDDAHYLSQVLLGWSIACLAVQATEWTEQSQVQYRIVPLTIDGFVGVGVEVALLIAALRSSQAGPATNPLSTEGNGVVSKTPFLTS